VTDTILLLLHCFHIAHSQFIGLYALTAVPCGAGRAYITWRRIGGHLPRIVANMRGKLGSTRGPRLTYAAALATIGAASQDAFRSMPALTGIDIARISPTTLCEADARVWVQQCAGFTEAVADIGLSCVIFHLAPYAMVPWLLAFIITDRDDWINSEPCMYI
jgi:hypothetical protein